MNATAASTSASVDRAALCQPTSRNRYLPAISDSVAITITSAMKIVNPVIHPSRGPSARVTQAKLVPQSGSARFSARYASEIQNIGTNDTSSTAGPCVPTPAPATSNPSVAAIEYAGAVDETPITTLDRKPIAPIFRPAGSA